MAMDFPSSPTNGQVFTSGGVVYTWNGYAWIGGGIPAAGADAPSDDKQYVRKNGLWVPIVPGHVLGEPSSGAPLAGEVGQLMQQTVSAVGIPASGNFNIASINLTPGDWDVSGYMMLNGGPLTSQTHTASLSTTSLVHGAAWASFTGPFQQFYNVTLTIIPTQFSVSVSTTVYLVGQITYNAGSGTVSGSIRARRMR